MRRAGRGALTLLTTVLLTSGPLTDVAWGARPDQADGFEVLGGHVYVVLGASLRNPTAETPLNEPLYNVAGLRLDASPGHPVTWGEWSSAAATSRAWRTGGPNGPRTDVRVDMEHLVPNGVYSMFWFTIGPDSAQPLCPGVERRLPLDAVTAQGPDPNSFLAGPSGAAQFHGRVEGDLLAATQFVLAVVYHADGQTYYPFPNKGEYLTQGPDCRSSFGHDAMVHLSIGQKSIV